MLGDQFAPELGHSREDAKSQAAVGSCGVDLGAGAGEHPQAAAAVLQFLDCHYQMLRVASQAVQFPDDEGVARLQGLQAGLQAWAVIMGSRGVVLVDAGTGEGIALQGEELGTVCNKCL